MGRNKVAGHLSALSYTWATTKLTLHFNFTGIERARQCESFPGYQRSEQTPGLEYNKIEFKNKGDIQAVFFSL